MHAHPFSTSFVWETLPSFNQSIAYNLSNAKICDENLSERFKKFPLKLIRKFSFKNDPKNDPRWDGSETQFRSTARQFAHPFVEDFILFFTSLERESLDLLFPFFNLSKS